MTSSQPCRLRRLFPCWDEPIFESVFNISVKHREEYSAVSNAPVRKVQSEGGMSWTHFHKTIPMPTYRLSLVIIIFNMVHFSNTNETLYIWCDPTLLYEVTYAFKISEQVRKKLDWYSRSSHKMQKMDLIATRDYKENSMGNWGVAFHR